MEYFPTLLSLLALLSLLSLFTLKPFSKLKFDDFSSGSPPTPSWTGAFFGDRRSYSFPSDSQQVRLRVHENVKHYAKNYGFLFLIFFALILYHMPVALVGVISSVALWELFKFCRKIWRLDESRPRISKGLVCIAQIVILLFLIYMNVQLALFYALILSYVVMILHAAFRKPAPGEQHSE